MTKKDSQTAITPFHLLIPAAGIATRMAHNIPKPYIKIAGKTILRHTIEKFLNISGLQSISVIINDEHRALYDQAVQGLNLTPPTTGCKTRKLSIYNGLHGLVKVKNTDTILIHDAARPLVQEQDIYNLLNTMEKNEAATLATAVTDTLYRENEDIPREDLWAIQTPQAFKFAPLIEAHENFKDNDDFTDDAGLIRAMGHKVEIVPSSRNNIKITTQEDLNMAEALLSNNTETRTTSGFDVHAFEKEQTDRPLMLGGIKIEHEVALTGHSDADVILHAVTDALLGSINEGDIGTHFPPSDSQWKNADSRIFLEKAAEMITERKGTIQFVDVTIMAETPKIGPHRQSIQNNIANILNIDADRISIKATTTEKLGFTGRKEGIACQALATVCLPMTK